MDKTLSASLIFSSCMLCQHTLANFVSPMLPEAYEPLEIEVDVPDSHALAAYVDVQDDTILIGYVYSNIAMLGPEFPPVSQILPGLSPGTYVVKTAYMADLSESDITINDTGMTFTVLDAPPAQQIFGLYHQGIGHFFVTASESEADIILTQGWQTVDFGFKAWPANGPAPDAALDVCRFYSSQVNSHFYTASEDECAMLREQDQGWEYEGIAFQALVPSEEACPYGTDPVWRLYNNRFAVFDSNHRFVTSSETYRSMIAQGWLGEGIAFCSPRQ